jgi:hypothetical protein
MIRIRGRTNIVWRIVLRGRYLAGQSSVVRNIVSEKHCQWEISSVRNIVNEKYCQWQTLSMKNIVSEKHRQWQTSSVRNIISEKNRQWKTLSVRNIVSKKYHQWETSSVRNNGRQEAGPSRMFLVDLKNQFYWAAEVWPDNHDFGGTIIALCSRTIMILAGQSWLWPDNYFWREVSDCYIYR